MKTYFQFRVDIEHAKPPVWRRFLIETGSTFEELHDAIQRSFGWMNCHLWEFREVGREGGAIAGCDSEFSWDYGIPLASDVELSEFFSLRTSRKKCRYTYDFGDSWDHLIQLEEIVESEESFHRKLLKGRCAGPPEDCGGLPMYDELAYFLRHGESPYEDGDEEYLLDTLEWIGEWDPDEFDLAAEKKRFDC